MVAFKLGPVFSQLVNFLHMVEFFLNSCFWLLLVIFFVVSVLGSVSCFVRFMFGVFTTFLCCFLCWASCLPIYRQSWCLDKLVGWSISAVQILSDKSAKAIPVRKLLTFVWVLPWATQHPHEIFMSFFLMDMICS